MEVFMPALVNVPDNYDPSKLSAEELEKRCNYMLSTLNKIAPASLANDRPGGTDPLDILDPYMNSIAYLEILSARVAMHGTPGIEANWLYIDRFLSMYDYRQVDRYYKNLPNLVGEIVKASVENDRALIGLQALQMTILRGRADVFSRFHLDLAKICLQHRQYSVAIPVLDVDVYDFPKSSDEKKNDYKAVRCRDVLEYYLYAGIIYAAVKNWQRSVDMFSYCINAPGFACSQIQVEALKKLMLVNLILEGDTPKIARHVARLTKSTYTALTRPYESFAAAFIKGDVEAFRHEISVTTDILMQDGNFGLAKLCMSAFRRKKIAALKETYVTLGIEKIAQMDFDVSLRVATVEETEALIQDMIATEEINASISVEPSTSKSMVHFHSNPPPEAKNLRALEEQIARAVALSKQLREVDRKLGLTKEYIRFSASSGRGKSYMSNPLGNVVINDPDVDVMDYNYDFDDSMDANLD